MHCPRRLDGALLLALLLPIFAIAPLVQHAGLPNTADGIIHLLRQVDFDRAFRAGAVVPRWGADLYGGFGYPLYIFAPPLFAYGVEMFFLPGLVMDEALKLAVILILELYSVGMFLFMRPKVGRWGALAAAALNVYAPLRMREALVTGGNYPQLLAMALFPLVLWSLDGVLQKRRGIDIVAAGVCAAALVLSHLFHAMIFVPVAASYVLLRLVTIRAPARVWAMVFAAGALALVLSAFFWLPTLAERSLTRTAAETYIQSSDFHQRFLSWQRLLAPPLPLDFAEANADVPLALGWAEMAAAGLGLTSVLWAAARERRGSMRVGRQPYAQHMTMLQIGRRVLMEPLWWVAVLVVSIYLQLPESAPVWEHVPLLPVAEFPWRFMGLSAFALAALGGYAAGRRGGTAGERADESTVTPRGREKVRSVLLPSLIIVGAIVTAFPYMDPPRGFVQLGSPSPATVLQYEQATGALGLTTINEYLPQTVVELPKDLPAPLSRPKIDLPADALQGAVWSPFGESERVSLTQAAAVRFRTFNYPGWSVSVDGAPVALNTLHDGTFSVTVPAGEHALSAHFDETPLRAAADAVSLLGIVGMVGLGAWGVAKRRGTERRPAIEPAPQSLAAERSPTGTQSDLITLPGGNANVGGSSRANAVTSLVLCALLLMLFIGKTFVVDPQGWIRASRFGEPKAVFGGQMELLGAESDAGIVTRGGDFHARFYWRPAQALTKDYHVFAQLMGPDGSAIAGSDKQHPGDPVVQGETPTSQIMPGTYLRDEHVIHIASNAPPGRYELKVGLYDPQSGTRLKLASGESMAAAGVVEIQ